MTDTSHILAEFEHVIRRDDARRGLLSESNAHWRQGDLARAAKSLLERTGTTAIVTGFAVPFPEMPIAETDGPLGTVLLAEVLTQLNRRVVLVTDDTCARALDVAAAAAGLREDIVQVMPWDEELADPWAMKFLRQHDLDHLISIERVGPSHTEASVMAQSRPHKLSSERFRIRVPFDHENRCHNMRGEMIDMLTSPTHRLFELAAALPKPPVTIGVGDGGNEIGMGSILWEDIAARLKGPQADWLPCRIATDCTILAGVSNWGGQALAAAVSVLAGRPELALAWTAERQRTVLDRLIQEGPAVDGATRRFEPTIDGLSFETYLGPWREMERLLGERGAGSVSSLRLPTVTGFRDGMGTHQPADTGRSPGSTKNDVGGNPPRVVVFGPLGVIPRDPEKEQR